MANLAPARQYHESALATFTELRMPRERDQAAAALKSPQTSYPLPQ